VLLGIRAAPKEDSSISAAEVVYGVPLALPGQAQAPDRPDSVEGAKIPLRDRSYADAVRQHVVRDAAYVYVREGPAGGPFQAAYRGPYRVLGRSEKVYKLQIGDRIENVSADRLKPHTGSEPEVAVPPVRGRPPGSGGGSSSGTS
jgi:hypothetical protein